jgi:acyl-CoA thioester hydrolase
MVVERSFRVRRYECDLYGHLNNAHYLRYLDAVDEELPAPCGAVCRIRLEYLKALGSGDAVRVVANGSDDQDGWQQRQYALFTGQHEAARGEVDFLAPNGHDLGRRIAAAAPQPEGTFRLYRPVEWRDVDMTGHVTIAALASLAEDSAIRVSAAHEWPLTRCADEGFAIVLRRHEIELGTPLTLDDEVEIATWASDRRRFSAIRHYLLRRVGDGGIVARFRSLYVWVNVTSGRPLRIPRDFLTSFAPNFATEATKS